MTWTEITQEQYDDALNALPPRRMAQNAFLLGEERLEAKLGKREKWPRVEPRKPSRCNPRTPR